MEQLIKEKGISKLIHFTQAENLENILNNGLLPRKTLDESGIESCYNDSYRYDKCTDAVCISIEFPNYKMFYKLRKDNPDKDWAVIVLDPAILWNLDCAFCRTNAGSADIYTDPIENRKGRQAFLALYESESGGHDRKNLNIPESYPTDPQAEVLVFGTIQQSHILSIVFKDKKTMEKYQHLIPEEIPKKVCSNFFDARMDYEHW